MGQSNCMVQRFNMSCYKLTFSVLTLLSVQAMVQAGILDWDCPQEGVNLRNRDQIGTPTKQNSWEDCAAQCHIRYACKLWTWVKPTGGIYDRNCAIMEDAGSAVYDANVISGERTCQGAAMNDYMAEYGDA